MRRRAPVPAHTRCRSSSTFPQMHRHDAPSAFHLKAQDIPKLTGDRSTARLILGESHGITGQAAPDLSLTLLDISLQSGGTFTHQGSPDAHAWILPDQGHIQRDLERGRNRTATGQSHRLCRCHRHLIFLRTRRTCRPVSGSPPTPSFCPTGPIRHGQRGRA